MEIVSADTVVLNVYYLAGEYKSKTENYGEFFFEIASNSFGVYIFYVQIYLRVFLNLLKSVTKIMIDNYLSAHCCISRTCLRQGRKSRVIFFPVT